jgi:hypothetical protein
LPEMISAQQLTGQSESFTTSPNGNNQSFRN